MAAMSVYRLQELLAPMEGPCVSIFQTTHRRHPDNHQDPIRFKNLVTEVEASLREKYPTREVRSLIEPLRALEANHAFWNHTLDGLAVFATADLFRVFKLQRAVPDLAIVADSLHVKPLLRFVQSADRYQVLCLTRGTVSLHEGNRDALDPINLAGEIPGTSADARTDSTFRQGHAPGDQDAEGHAERFFRAVDRGVLEHHSRPSGLPLILVALAESQTEFRKITHNPLLLAEGVSADPGSLSPEALREAAWAVDQPHYLQRLAGLVGSFEEARAKNLASGDLSDIAQAAIAGRVGTLLVDADKEAPGTLDPSTGIITFGDLAHPVVDDLIDDLAEHVLRMGGEVVVTPADRMPTASGAAAIYRF